jgi:transcription initiation factor TFIIB
MLTIHAVNNGINKSIIEEAKVLYKKVSESTLSRGSCRKGLIASSIYISCKNNKVARSAKEIAKIFNLDATTITRGCKRFTDLMKMNYESTTADDFINRFCSKLNLDMKKREICRNIVAIADENSLASENNPPSLAAASIYMSSELNGWKLEKKYISEMCEISQVTIVKCFKKLDIYKGLFVPPA